MEGAITGLSEKASARTLSAIFTAKTLIFAGTFSKSPGLTTLSKIRKLNDFKGL